MATKKKPCKVCKHRNVDAINRKIRNKESIASLAKAYKIDRATLTKHKKVCLATRQEIKLSEPGAEDLRATEVMLKEVDGFMQFVHKMVAACDKYLTDPDNPDEYFLGTRGNEIDVVYNTIDEEGKVNNQQKKATLQSLLDAVEASDRFIVCSLSSKHSDPRDLLLKSVDKFEKTAKMLMEVSQKLIENEFKNKSMSKIDSDGVGTVTFEETVQEITKRVVIASRGNENQKLSEIAELPEIKQI